MNTTACFADGDGGGLAEDSGMVVISGFWSVVGLNSPIVEGLSEELPITKDDLNMEDVVNCEVESGAVERSWSTVLFPWSVLFSGGALVVIPGE